MQEAGLRGDEEVQQDAVVEGDALQQEDEVAVRVGATGTSFLQQSKAAPLRAPPTGGNEQRRFWFGRRSI